ncbi:MAG TPA: hypothetical protein PLB25_15495 [Rhodoferax sp.]|mgnify:CR=1 FL=1|nr:hypothetical protein [Rhodoferax sp.]
MEAWLKDRIPELIKSVLKQLRRHQIDAAADDFEDIACQVLPVEPVSQSVNQADIMPSILRSVMIKSVMMTWNFTSTERIAKPIRYCDSSGQMQRCQAR